MLIHEAHARIQKAKSERLTLLNLSELQLTHLPVELHAIPWLEGLFASFNNISDLAILEDLPNLRRVDFRGNQIRNTSPLSRLHQLSYLDIAGNGLDDIYFLNSLTSIETLYLEDN